MNSWRRCWQQAPFYNSPLMINLSHRLKPQWSTGQTSRTWLIKHVEKTIIVLKTFASETYQPGPPNCVFNSSKIMRVISLICVELSLQIKSLAASCQFLLWREPGRRGKRARRRTTWRKCNVLKRRAWCSDIWVHRGEYSAAGKVITRILAKYSKTKVETTHKLNCYPFNEGLKAGEIGQAFHQAGWMFFRLKNQRKNISGNPSAWHQIFLHFLIRPNISSCMMPRFLRQKGNTRTDNALLFPKPIHLIMMAMI